MNIHMSKDENGRVALRLRSQNQDDEAYLMGFVVKAPASITVDVEQDNPMIVKFGVDPGEDTESPVADKDLDRDLRQMSLEELQTLCAQRGVAHERTDTKNQLIRKLKAADG